MLKAGFARIDVTPPFGAEIAGYFVERRAKGILDPITLSSLAVGDGDRTYLFMSIDFIGISLKYNIEIREAISKRTGIPTDRIVIAALHQHTSCSIDDFWGNKLTDTTYIEVLFRRFGDVAIMSVEDMMDAKIGTGECQTAEPIAFVRRYYDEEGKVHTNPSSKLKIVKRCAEADNTVRVVRFKREGAKDIAIVNFSTHPDVIGKEKLSADWPGFTRRFVEEDNPNVSCIFFTGTQGDSNHIDFFKPKEERRKGATGYDHSRYMGRTVADGVKSIWDSIECSDCGAIRSAYRVLYTPTNVTGLEDSRNLMAWYNDYKAGKLDYEPTIEECGRAERARKLAEQPILRPIPLTVFEIGDFAFVGFGGEPFTEYGSKARALAPEKFVMCAVCANGYEGYFPTVKAFEEGGYEVGTSFFYPTVENEIIGELKLAFENLE